MQKMMAWMESALLPMASAFSANRYLSALQAGFLMALPLTIFGSLFVVLAYLPFLDNYLSPEAYAFYQALLAPAYESSIALMTVFVVIGIAYHLARSYEVDALFGALVAFSAFCVLTPFTVLWQDATVSGVIPLDRLGAKGMFVGILVSITSVEIYRRVVQANWVIRMPEGVPPAVSRSFSSLIPVIVTLSVFMVLRYLFSLTPQGNIHDLVYAWVQKPLTRVGSGLLTTLLAQCLQQLLWFIGIHGTITVNSVMDPIWYPLSLENLEAFNTGAPLPHVVTKSFVEIFTAGLGGSGLTLGVLLAIFFCCRSKQLRMVAKVSTPPGIFNINEPLVFGIPIVLNPVLFIPWVVAPVIAVCITYFTMATGLVPRVTGVTVPWTTPVFLNGMMATSSLRGGLLQLFNIFVVMLIWIPFLRVLDKKYCQDEHAEQQNAQEA